MLALQRRKDANNCTANILPCRVHYDGPVKVTKRYWSPRVDKDATATSYFRGRKLRGKVMKLPPGYEGVILKPTDRYLPQSSKAQSGRSYTTVDDDIEIADEEEEPPEPVKILEETFSFQDVIVWGHDLVPTHEDSFVKGIEEWISFSEAIHNQPNKQSESSDQDGGLKKTG